MRTSRGLAVSPTTILRFVSWGVTLIAVALERVNSFLTLRKERESSNTLRSIFALRLLKSAKEREACLSPRLFSKKSTPME